jgi:hypothetical protein
MGLPIFPVPGMEGTPTMRLQVLAVRILLGVVFGVLLSRVFFPEAGIEVTVLICGLLIFFSYAFEYLRKRGGG